MADETTHVTEKVYCYDHPSAYHNDNALIGAIMSQGKTSGCDQAAMMSMLNNANNNWQNNPFMYLIWLAFFGGGNGFGWGNRADAAQATAENYNSRQIAALQDTVNTNHNNDLALQAINGNTAAIAELAQTVNSDYNTMSQAVNAVKSAVDQVGATVGYTSESIKNAIALGDSNIIAKMQDCCCQQKQLILEQGYQNQLATERQTNVLGGQIADFRAADQLQTCQQTNALSSAINETRQAVVNGFANLGYQNSQNTAAIINANNQNTQRILDQLCQNTTQALRDSIAEKDRQLQTANIIAGLKASGCNCACAC